MFQAIWEHGPGVATRLVEELAGDEQQVVVGLD
jgi:hypothetical protein